MKTGSERVRWDEVLQRAAEIVGSYDTSVTLRQLFYRLVSEQLLENARSVYNNLSRYTVDARRAGKFPDLIDQGRSIDRSLSFDSPDDALGWLASIYRIDRTIGQQWSIYLGVEKKGQVAQLRSWFEDLGLTILALAGYSSGSFERTVKGDVADFERPAVLIYAGDFDPSGEDILRNFIAQTGCFKRIERIALNSEQIEKYGLPENEGKRTDSRASGFVQRHGRLCQVELDALPPDTLRGLYSEAIDRYFDYGAYDQAMRLEQEQRAELAAATGSD